MRIAICDDEPADLKQLKQYATKYNPRYPITCFNSGKALLHALNNTTYDVILLDIEMDAPNGYDTAKIIKDKKPESLVIFTTKSLDYAIRGYGIAFRYLPKPITYQMLCKTLDEVEAIVSPEKIELQSGYENIIVTINDILYFESYSHKIIFHLKDGQAIESQGSLATILNQLSRNTFVQIHKSYCINLDYLSSTTNTSALLKDGTTLPIGRGKRESFYTAVQDYIRRIKS